MKHIYLFISSLILCLYTVSCVEDPELKGKLYNALVPEVLTIELSDTTATTIKASAEIVKENGSRVTEKGFCWSTTPEFTLSESLGKKVSGSEDVIFDETITELTDSTQYYLKAYAINEVGTGYGEVHSFFTRSGKVSLVTLDATDIRSTHAVLGGQLYSKGEGEIKALGIIYSISSLTNDAAVRDTFFYDMQGSEEITVFTSTIENLRPLTRYYYQAFADNEFGIVKGDQKEFETTDGKPSVGSLRNVHIDYTEAMFSAEIIDVGDAEITEYGFCYGEAEDPTIEDNPKVEGVDSEGSFSATITNLEQQKIYYVRAYAINSYGISYSNNLNFNLQSQMPIINTNPIQIASYTRGYIEVSGEVIDEGMGTVVESGFFISTSPNVSETNGTRYPISSGKGLFWNTFKVKGSATYYIKAYALTEDGKITFGGEESIETPAIFNNVTSFNGAVRIPGSAGYFAVNNKGYLLGGDAGGNKTNEFWTFSPSTNSWNPLATYPQQRSRMAVGSTNDVVLAYGGLDNNGNPTDDAYYYTYYNNRWSPINRGSDFEPGQLSNSIGLSDGSMIYLIGGQTIGQQSTSPIITNEVWGFNPDNQMWSILTPLPERQYNSIGLMVNNKIYAGLGQTSTGTYPTSSAKLWSSVDGAYTWQEEGNFIGGVVRAAVAHYNSIYVINDIGRIYKYDINSKNWESKSQLSVNMRDVHCMYTINDIIYIGLGSDSNQLISYDPLWDN